MTAAPIHQDNTFHAARATADRDWRIPIVKAKGVVAPLPSPLEFDARVKPRLVFVPALGGLALLAIAIASVFALCAWMIPNG